MVYVLSDGVFFFFFLSLQRFYTFGLQLAIDQS